MRTNVPISSGPLIGVAHEMDRQQEKWGSQSWPNGTNGTFTGLRDLAQQECQEAYRDGTLTWRHILQEEFFEALAEEDPEPLIAELEQVAAVCATWIADIKSRSVIDRIVPYLKGLPALEDQPVFQPVRDNPQA